MSNLLSLRQWLSAALLLCVLVGSAHAVVEIYEFESEVERQRYLSFLDELRCPKCQNQNLAGSDSPIAADLRRELRRMLDEGRSDKEITDFMVSRYGEYVLYRPKLQSSTFILWGLPLAFVLLALVVIGVMIRRRATTSSNILVEGDQRRLDELLAQAEARKQQK